MTGTQTILIEVLATSDTSDIGLVCDENFGDVYAVGPAQTYQNIGDVPFSQLNAGDHVNIYWREAPYREKILLSASGTAEHPICVSGIKGDNGQLPVIDGNGATTSSQMITSWLGTQTRGLFIIAQKPGDAWGYKPSNIVVQNLELRGAYHDYSFTDSAGNTQTYTDNAASVFVERGENILFRGITITDSGNGFFVASSGDEEMLSKNITLEHSYIYGNGTSSYRHHNLYTEALGMTIQFNRFGPLRAGAQGDNLKDRSAGTVIRYNWVEGSPSQLLDLVEAEDTWTLVNNNPQHMARYRKTFVYGNTLINTQSRNTVHYGGDNGEIDTYRKGMLYFYNNTVIFDDRNINRWAVTLFRLETADESVDARNNIIYHFGGDAIVTLMNVAGTAYFYDNIINQSYENWYNRTDETADGIIQGLENINQSSAPFFIDDSNYNFQLAVDSQSINSATELNNDALSNNNLEKEYLIHQGSKDKQLNGQLDMGAFEK